MGHSEGTVVGKFCAIRAPKCDLHGNQYQKNCQPPPVGWDAFFFIQGKQERVVKTFEAHHTVCVACVTEFIALDPNIGKIVKETDWCVNEKLNMFAMPLWGHTIKYYANMFEDVALDDLDAKLQAGKLFKTNLPPLFANIPQHDYDHNSSKGYKQEVDGKLRKLAMQVAKTAKKNHEAAVTQLKSDLDTLSTYFKGELVRRGSTRCGGTHNAWKTGMKDPSSNWYEPFSMANDGCADPRPFPVSGGKSKVLAKLRALLEALGRWGST